MAKKKSTEELPEVMEEKMETLPEEEEVDEGPKKEVFKKKFNGPRILATRTIPGSSVQFSGNQYKIDLFIKKIFKEIDGVNYTGRELAARIITLNASGFPIPRNDTFAFNATSYSDLVRIIDTIEEMKKEKAVKEALEFTPFNSSFRKGSKTVASTKLEELPKIGGLFQQE